MNQFHAMPAAKYYADPCERPSLSQSTAHVLISRSAQHAYRQHPRLGGKGRTATKAMDLGTVIHTLILEGVEGCEGVELLGYDNFKTKAAQADRDAAISAGKIPMLMDDWQNCKAVARATREQLSAIGIEFGGHSECVGLWTERADDGTEVQCRCRIDHWLEPVIFDLKTAGDASSQAIERSIVEHGYDIQAAAYISAAEKSFPELRGRIRFINVFVETEPPYLINTKQQDGLFLALGRSKWRRAVNLWAKCLRDNDWPGYSTDVTTVAPPTWAVNREMEVSPYTNDIQQECPV